MGIKERLFLLFVVLVSCITGSHFSAVSTVIAARDKLKLSLPCLAGGEENLRNVLSASPVLLTAVLI